MFTQEAPRLCRIDDKETHKEMSMSRAETILFGLVKRFCAQEAAGVSATYQLNLTGDEGGNWYLSVSDEKCSVGTGTSAHSDVTITMTADDWVDLLSGKLDGYTAFLQGRVDVQGDLSLALRLQSMFGF
jgi:putative sterol carrier protein